MSSIRVRCYAELNSRLPAEKRGAPFDYPVAGETTPRGLLERLGISPGEVDLILINGRPAALTDPVAPGDRLSLFPVFETFDISGLEPAQGAPLRTTCFILEGSLGKLARLLRMVGFDADYDADLDAASLVRRSNDEKRIILTQSAALLVRSDVQRACLISAARPLEQLKQVLERFHLNDRLAPFSRCLCCNSPVEQLDAPPAALRPEILARFSEFFHCPGCGRTYWKGSHYRRMAEHIVKLRSAT